MTDLQKRELDAWIAANVFDYPVNFEAGRRKHGPGYLWYIPAIPGQRESQCEEVKRYITDHAASRELEKKICEQSYNRLEISTHHGIWRVKMDNWNDAAAVEAETLELALALLAKKLFSK